MFKLTQKQVAQGWTTEPFGTRSRGRQRVCKKCHSFIYGLHAVSPSGTHYHFLCSYKARIKLFLNKEVSNT
jgi:hypothetical protein